MCKSSPGGRLNSAVWAASAFLVFKQLANSTRLNSAGMNQFVGRHDTQHNNILHNDIQYNDIQNNDIQHNNIQHNIKVIATLSITTLNTLCWKSFMLSVTYKPIMLSVFMLSVFMLNVVAPFVEGCKVNFAQYIWIKFGPYFLSSHSIGLRQIHL